MQRINRANPKSRAESARQVNAAIKRTWSDFRETPKEALAASLEIPHYLFGLKKRDLFPEDMSENRMGYLSLIDRRNPNCRVRRCSVPCILRMPINQVQRNEETAISRDH